MYPKTKHSITGQSAQLLYNWDTIICCCFCCCYWCFWFNIGCCCSGAVAAAIVVPLLPPLFLHWLFYAFNTHVCLTWKERHPQYWYEDNVITRSHIKKWMHGYNKSSSACFFCLLMQNKMSVCKHGVTYIKIGSLLI